VFTGVDPRAEFQKARDEAESNEVNAARGAGSICWRWTSGLFARDSMTLEPLHIRGVKSIFREIAPFVAPWEDRGAAPQRRSGVGGGLQGRVVTGHIGMRDLSRMAADGAPLPAIVGATRRNQDFAVFVGMKATRPKALKKLLAQRKDRG